MAIDTWPSSLPQSFLLSGYSEGMGDGRIKSNTDTGPAKIRRRSTAIPEPVTGQLLLSQSQKQTLKSFILETLLGGTLPFRLSGKVYRFDAFPSFKPITPNLYISDFTLEALPQ